MRNRIFAVLAIAILAGGGLAYGTYNLMQNQPVKTVSTPTQAVVVASTDLSIGAEIKQNDLQVVIVPGRSGARGGVRQARGRRRPRPLIPRRQERAGPRGASWRSKEAGVGLPPVIPEGMRAVSVRVNEVVGVAGYVLPGTRVDVRQRPLSPNNQPGDTTSKVVLANVQVLTAGTRLEQDQEDGKPMQVTVVTLLVTPEQSERLALASTEGKIQLALRNPLDQGAPQTPGIRPAVLMGLVKGPSPRDAARRRRRSKPGQPVTMEIGRRPRRPWRSSAATSAPRK